MNQIGGMALCHAVLKPIDFLNFLWYNITHEKP